MGFWDWLKGEPSKEELRRKYHSSSESHEDECPEGGEHCWHEIDKWKVDEDYYLDGDFKPTGDLKSVTYMVKYKCCKCGKTKTEEKVYYYEKRPISRH